ncbi:hypothetical protein ADIS_0535 [Lunatimonas lonarensis]|uniref:Uncharacterized protein n=1 Tax=Lunatimonas lonarensis TaxID=1232681 RepID=R7ZXZ7_9BACT|nr:tetratricopeptide repeat protein [Lunatimonas lonarensis]EON78942.1 hypothetical protein ADIS_0535 [Lunatimonas lonarensis]
MTQKPKSLLFLSFLLLALFGSSCDTVENKKGRFLLKGNGKLQEGDLQGAIRFYEEAIRLDNSYADAFYNRGIAYQRLANFQRAIGDFEKALEANPNYEDARYQKAVAHLDFGENYRALEEAKKLTQTEEYAAKGYFILGLTYAELSEYGQALNAFEMAIERTPENVDLWVNRATIRYYQGDYGKALSDLAQAKQLTDREPNIYNLLGLIDFEAGKYQEALENVELAIRLNPNQPYYYNNRGLFRLFDDQLEEGLADINYSLSVDPANLHALRNKGIYYYLKGEKELASQYLREVAAKNNKIPMVMEYLEKLN